MSLGLTPTTQSRYWDTNPPTGLSLAYATTFFRNHLPRKLWTATEWRNANQASEGGVLIPEVAFLGRSNVGKSSLLNALLMAGPVNRVGPRPGKTTTMHCWGLSASDPKTLGALKGARPGKPDMKLAVLDMPGYGHASHGDWGQEIITYLKRRKHLRRVFVLLDAMHGVKESDTKMLDLLRQESISHQIIASKVDRVSPILLDASLAHMQAAVQPSGSSFKGLGEILVTGSLGDGRSNSTVKASDMVGIEDVRYAVLAAVGLENRELVEAVPKIRTVDPGPRIRKQEYDPWPEVRRIEGSEKKVVSPFRQLLAQILKEKKESKTGTQMEEEIERLSSFSASPAQGPQHLPRNTAPPLDSRHQPSLRRKLLRQRAPPPAHLNPPPPTPRPERSVPVPLTPSPLPEATKPKAAFPGAVGHGMDALMEMTGKKDKAAPSNSQQPASRSGIGRGMDALMQIADTSDHAAAGSRRRRRQRSDAT